MTLFLCIYATRAIPYDNAKIRIFFYKKKNPPKLSSLALILGKNLLISQVFARYKNPIYQYISGL